MPAPPTPDPPPDPTPAPPVASPAATPRPPLDPTPTRPAGVLRRVGAACGWVLGRIGWVLASTWRLTARAGRATARGTWWLIRPGDGVNEGRRQLAGRLLLLVTTAVCYFIAFGTSGTVYDVARTGLGLMPFVAAVAGLPIALVATRPLLGLMVSVGGAFVLTETVPGTGALVWPWLVIHGLVMMALLAATCAREPLGRAVGAWLITASLFYWGSEQGTRAGWAVGITAVAIVGLLAGRLIRARTELSRSEEETAAEKAARVVLEERARIARDLHDIVAHHMSLVVVQAETARYRVPGLGEQALAEFASIGESARSALTETRALLAVLRAEDEEAAKAPQPGLAELADLVEGARRAGVDLTASLAPDLPLRESDALAVYRIAQEALANASRHAPGSPVRLVLERVPEGVRLEIVNGVAAGPRPATPSPSAGGHGITGMRERATAAGGRVSAGPIEAAEGGGFRVEFVLEKGEVWAPG